MSWKRRALLDVAHSPGEVTPAATRKNIASASRSRGILSQVPALVAQRIAASVGSPASAGEPKWIEEIGEEQDMTYAETKQSELSQQRCCSPADADFARRDYLALAAPAGHASFAGVQARNGAR